MILDVTIDLMIGVIQLFCSGPDTVLLVYLGEKKGFSMKQNEMLNEDLSSEPRG